MSRNFPNPFMPDLSQYGRMAFGGGGGQSSTQDSGLPDWARPYVEQSLGDATDLYSAGAFEHVEGLTPEQVEGLERRKQLGARGGVLDSIAKDSYGATQAYRDAAGGQGLFGADALGKQTEALASSIGSAQQGVLGQYAGNYSRTGNLGGARAEAAATQAALQVGGDLAAAELSNRRQAALSGAGGTLGAGEALQNQFGAGANAVGQVGSQLQAQQQNEGDAAYQGVQRLFGLYSSPSLGKTSTTNTTGGK